MAKNERQHLQNLARAQPGAAAGSGGGAQVERKKEIDRTLATTRASTASMGKFDRMLEGEKKPRGVKRKVPYLFLAFNGRVDASCFQFDPMEKSVEAEKSVNLALIKKLGSDHSSLKKARRDAGGDGGGDGNLLNVRKAVRFASDRQGAVALARKSASRSGGKQKRNAKR